MADRNPGPREQRNTLKCWMEVSTSTPPCHAVSCAFVVGEESSGTVFIAIEPCRTTAAGRMCSGTHFTHTHSPGREQVVALYDRPRRPSPAAQAQETGFQPCDAVGKHDTFQPKTQARYPTHFAYKVLDHKDTVHIKY